jgi:hypothetical protein
MSRFVAFALFIAFFAMPVTGEEVSPELQATVPELTALHHVVSPLWHDAWPNRNFDLIRESLPELESGVSAVSAAALPGILRDKNDAWKAGVAELESSLGATQNAAAADDEQAMLDGVEAVHAAFEALVRVVRPPMKELDAYHQVLYTIYHKALPAADLAALRSGGEELAARCEALAAASLPRRAAGREESVTGAIASLCSATAELRQLPADAALDVVTAAVEKVHTAYQASEAAFE